MHIAIIRQRYNPYGGAERFVSRALAALQKTDIKVSLVARKWEPIEGVDFIECKPFYLGRLWRDWSFARLACQKIALLQADLVQSHERVGCCDIYRAGDGVHRVQLAQKAKCLPWFARVFLPFSLYHNYLIRAEKKLFENPRLKAVICNSMMVKNEILQHFAVDAEKIHVIYNGVDTAKFHPNIKQESDSIKAKYGLPEDATIFVFVGSGFERKGLLQALKAFSGLPEQCCLLVVGYDKRSRRYKKAAQRLKIESRVQFLGPQDNVLPFYAVADAVVLPTLYDPFPNVALEALACGVALITSTTSGAAEVVIDNENGFVRDALDTDGIREAMGKLCDKKVAARMGQQARASTEKYDLDTMAGHLTGLYQKLLFVRP